ncbi:MAG TPA: hypothetical protein VKJ77_23670, partial [Caballeronia sp.]|nr:hypothetical protein [Caballeronia sp.]
MKLSRRADEMFRSPSRSFQFSKVLIAIGIVASALHFGDNAMEMGTYPQPAWITPAGIVIGWTVAAALAVVALMRRSRDGIFATCATGFALVLISGHLHYYFGSAMQMTAFGNATVAFEVVTGCALVISL